MHSNLALKTDREFTYGDYLTWPEGERWEIIDGSAYDMSPGPTIDHQLISGELLYQFKHYLRNKTCLVIDAPIDVLFPEPDQDIKNTKNYVQPDIIVVCDHKKLHERKRCAGPPDLIIEILSPSTACLDMKDKRKLYEHEGVREYWIVDPANKLVQVFILENNKYKIPEIYTKEDKVKVGIFPDLEIDLNHVFKNYIIDNNIS
jgi:Uma2 family endonuclease